MKITADLKKNAELFTLSELKIFRNKTMTEFTQTLKNNQSQQSYLTYKKQE